MTFSAYILAWNAAAIICLIIGIALWILEMFTPGLGVPALLGSISLIAAIVLSARSLSHALITLALILILLGVCAFFVFRAFSHGKLHRIVLHESVDGDSTPLKGMADMIGREGVTLTTLRPAGDADFDGQRLDVVSEGAFIEKGSKVRIASIEGLRIIVKQV